MHVRKANRAGPDETASSGSALIAQALLAGKARIFLLVDLRDFFSNLGSRAKKNKKKTLKKTS